MIISYNGSTINVDNPDKQFQVLGVLFQTPSAVKQINNVDPTTGKRKYVSRKRGRKHMWTEEERARIWELYNGQNRTASSVAKEFGVSVKSINQQLHRLRQVHGERKFLPESEPTSNILGKVEEVNSWAGRTE